MFKSYPVNDMKAMCWQADNFCLSLPLSRFKAEKEKRLNGLENLDQTPASLLISLSLSLSGHPLKHVIRA